MEKPSELHTAGPRPGEAVGLGALCSDVEELGKGPGCSARGSCRLAAWHEVGFPFQSLASLLLKGWKSVQLR